MTARTAPQSDAAQRRAKTEHPAQSPKMAATVAPAGHICVLPSNGDDGNRIPLDASAAATVTFGRALTSDVRIALAHCSRLHAELRVDQNARVSLVNHAKAANATLLNPRGDDGDRRRVEEEYAERFPSINFVAGLDDELTSMRTQLGVDADWKEAVRKLYYEPFVVLVDPDGGMRGRSAGRRRRCDGVRARAREDRRPHREPHRF